MSLLQYGVKDRIVVNGKAECSRLKRFTASRFMGIRAVYYNLTTGF